nr:uncharacterized protein LOC121128361 [Lepeophtheirus salmonis]
MDDNKSKITCGTSIKDFTANNKRDNTANNKKDNIEVSKQTEIDSGGNKSMDVDGVTDANCGGTEALYEDDGSRQEVTSPPSTEKVISTQRSQQRKKITTSLGYGSNANNQLWGSRETDTRGESLENIIDENNLTVINEGNEPTFITQRASSTIDTPIVSTSSREQCDLRPSMSDHRYIVFGFGKYMPIAEQSRNFRKTDWCIFRSHTESSSLPVIDSNQNVIDDCAESLNKVMNMGLYIGCPKRRTIRAKSIPWWTKPPASLRYTLSKLEPKLHRSSHRYEYLIAKNAYRSALRKEQGEYKKILLNL